MKARDRLMRFVIALYPRRFRREYEREMLAFARDWQCDRDNSAYRFWIDIIADAARSVPREWIMEARSTLNTGGLFMKALGALSLVIGAFQGINACREAVGGGISGRPAPEEIGLVLAIVSAAFLVAAGIDMLRRGSQAVAIARIAGAAMVVVFGFLALSTHMLSQLALLLGIVFPIAMLVYLQMSRGGKSGATAG
jgi:hypothetical protein